MTCARASRTPARACLRATATVGSTSGSATTHSRSGSTTATGFTSSACSPGTATGCSTRPVPAHCPAGTRSNAAMRRWHFSPRRHVPHALLERLRARPAGGRLQQRADAGGRSVHRRGAAARPPARRLRRELGPHGGQGRDLAAPRPLRRAERRHARRSRPLPRHRSRTRDRDGLAADGRLPRGPSAQRVRVGGAPVRAGSRAAGGPRDGKHADERAVRGTFRRAPRRLARPDARRATAALPSPSARPRMA